MTALIYKKSVSSTVLVVEVIFF